MKNLGSYLNDHLAGSTGALDLIGHLAEASGDGELAVFLGHLKDEVEADKQTLREVMTQVGVEESAVRKTGAWLAEKLSRARLGVAGTEAGELGALLGLELLELGVTGKKLLWRTLGVLARPELRSFDFSRLETSAAEQAERIEAYRIRTAHEALK